MIAVARASVTAGLLALAAAVTAAEMVRATVIDLLEHEAPETSTNPVRMIVTPGFLRIDGGHRGRGFLLFERAARTVYDVDAGDRLILVIPAAPAPAPAAAALRHRVERESVPLPAVDGKRVLHYRLFTNGQLCDDLYAAAGLLPGAVEALVEYRRALAGQQGAALAAMPADLQSPCDMADHVYAPARHLAYGFPVRVTETSGSNPKHVRTTELTDYRTEWLPRTLFRLPPDYRRMALRELQAR